MYTEDLISKINNVMISNHSFEFLLSLLPAYNIYSQVHDLYQFQNDPVFVTAVTVVSVDIILVRFMIAFLKSVIMLQHTEQEYYLCS